VPRGGGVSRDFFDEHIEPELRIVPRGSKTILIPLAELECWLDKSATRSRAGELRRQFNQRQAAATARALPLRASSHRLLEGLSS
jgi:hypothetical protein